MVVGVFAICLVFAVVTNSVTCAKCGYSKHKSGMLIFHAVTEDKKELAIPYCPKCCVEVLNNPALTWAGNQ